MAPTASTGRSDAADGGPRRPTRVVHWYRTDLRVHDSTSLAAALALDPEVLWPVWTWDPAYVYQHRVGPNRWRFLLESMTELSTSLTAINPKQRLHVLRGSPDEVFEWIFARWEGVSHLVYETDTSAYARSRDEVIGALAKKHGIEVVPVLGHTLWSVPDVIRLNGNKPTTTFAQLAKATEKLPAPARPLPIPENLPDPGPILLPDDEAGFLGSGWIAPIDLNGAELGGYRTSPPSCFDPSERSLTTVPSESSLGLPDDVDRSIPGGESAALYRLQRLCSDPAWVAGFAKPKSSPAACVDDFMEGEIYRGEYQGTGGQAGSKTVGGGSTFVLSPFLKFGCLSVRKFWHDAHDAVEVHKATAKKSGKLPGEPENLAGQLRFRECWISAEYATPNFGRMVGNPVCRYIDWKCQTKYDKEGAEILPRPKDDDPLAEEFLEAWTFGRTGFPWIDALMRQLRQQGWIHHLGRHSVACFLTRGNLWISWERGAEVFDELLLDWDPACNAANWMWLSCSAFFSQYYRVYSPVAFPVKWDKTGQLVRKYCPELKDMPDKWVYCPWEAPLAVQKKVGCIIGKDYPAPIIDYKAAQDENIARMKSAYAFKLHGTDKAVLDGRAGKMLDDAYAKTATKAVKVKPLAKAEKDDVDGDGKRPANPFDLAKENATKRRKVKAE